MRVGGITSIGSFTALSPSSADYLSLDRRSTGLGGPVLRNPTEDKSGTDGVMVFDRLEGAWRMTLVGEVVIRSDGSESGYFAAIDTLYDSLKSALDAMKTSSGVLVHATGTLDVRYDTALEPSWDDIIMSVTFGLIVDA